ncbi:MAG: porin [Candidatus Moranbacteria bacterium]|nr:porin [Candidatus Moranbacteria bacterium]
MRTLLLALVGATCLTAPGVALAQEVSGDIAVVSSYIDDDGFNYSQEDGREFAAGTAVQASLNISLGKSPCEIQFWGSKTLRSRLGDEFDAGFSCSIELDEKTEVTGTVSHFSLAGDDIVKFEGSLSHKTPIGTVDLMVSHYTWAQEDATRFQLGFSSTVSDSFDLRLYATRETGFGLDPIVTAGVSGEYHLSERFSLTANLVAPVSKYDGDPRATQFAVGIRATF